MERYSIVYQYHAVERMALRGIQEEEIEHILRTREVIAVYADDAPYPSELLLGWSHARPLHVVVATDITNHRKIIIMTYQPDPRQWEEDFKRRKR